MWLSMCAYTINVWVPKTGVAVEAEGIPACYFQQCGGRQ